MAFITIRRLVGRRQRSERPEPDNIDGGDLPRPAAPWTERGPGVREIRTYSYGGGRRHEDDQRPRVLSGALLWLAGLVIAAALTGAGYVAYEAQRTFAFKHNGGDVTRAAITAALPDAGWIAMAIVALVAALLGRSSARARLGVILFFGLSLGAQILDAKAGIEGLLVAVIPPITLAWMLESFVVEVRRWASSKRGLELDETPIMRLVFAVPVSVLRGWWRLGLWGVRLCFDTSGTWGGVREWVLDEAPLAPGRTLASLRAQQAIEQAGTTSAAAAEARAAALAEAEEIRTRAQQEVEQARQEAAEQVTEARTFAEQEIERVRADAEQQVSTIRADTERQIAAARAESEQHVDGVQTSTERQMAELRQQMQAALDQVRREAADEVEQARERARSAQARAERDRTAAENRAAAELEAVHSSASAQLRELQERNRRLDTELERFKGEYDQAFAGATAKARLRALYEQLGRSGDRRYLDRHRVGEVARELAGEAGLQSEGTARAYLGEYLDERGVPREGQREEIPA